MAGPVLRATTPLTPTAKAYPAGRGTARSNRVGQKEYWHNIPARPHSMAVWSSLPPKVPTPASPDRLPKLCPFSTVPR